MGKIEQISLFKISKFWFFKSALLLLDQFLALLSRFLEQDSSSNSFKGLTATKTVFNAATTIPGRYHHTVVLTPCNLTNFFFGIFWKHLVAPERTKILEDERVEYIQKCNYKFSSFSNRSVFVFIFRWTHSSNTFWNRTPG